jgi:hypothetical protein
VRGRRPLGTDAELDYEVMSDQDWEEEPEGESLSVSGVRVAAAAAAAAPCCVYTGSHSSCCQGHSRCMSGLNRGS